ncbi:MAG: hypothetical protein ACI8XO_003961 [Verrucomicrobiales bacterium]|jgi:hypothetical protein
MKPKSILLATGASVLALSFATVSPVQADLKEAARKLHDESNAALVGIKGLLKIDVTRNGQPAGNQESPIWGNGLVIGDGMVVTAYRSIMPDVAAQAQGGAMPPGVEIKTKLAEIKFVNGSGEEYDAKLILHDEDLDLAFLAIDPKAENSAAWEVKPIGITADPEVQLLDDVISLSRQSATLRFAPAIGTGYVTSVVKRPRLLYAVKGMSHGAPAFAEDGAFIGLVTMRKSASNKQPPVAVILPAKYLRKLVPQAIEKQEELKNAKDTDAEVEEEKAEPAEDEKADPVKDQKVEEETEKPVKSAEEPAGE